MITYERLKELLSYNPQTGDFTWLIAVSDKIKIGGAAGSLSSGYRCIKINGRRYQEHRLAWLYQTGAWPKHQIDHKNLNKIDNRWDNLREATPSQNTANTRGRGQYPKGVTLHKCGKFQSQIKVNGTNHYLGLFSTCDGAQAAYLEASTKYFGEFARAA